MKSEMRNRLIWIVAPLTASLVLAVSCGDGVPQASFPVESSRTMDSLSPSDLDAICREMHEVVQQAVSKHELCVMTGKAMSHGAQTCQDGYNVCMQKNEAQLWADYDCGLAVEGCKATVQEFETCFNDGLRALRDYLSGITCDSARQPPEDPPSCKVLEAECPGL